MNVLSLFDGMSCGQIALNKIGIKPAKYYAAEIDKYAIQVTQANYPKTIQLGSVTEWRDWGINWSSIDLVSGGFPCQAWSMAGKQLGDKDERGMLFWVMLDIMKHAKSHNPKIKLLIENVKMKKEFEEYITHHTEQALGEVNKVLINSALVSAQNRSRYYWTNWHVEQPEDKGIVLADIIEVNVDSEFISKTPKNHNNGNQLNPNYKSQANTIHDVNSKMPTICAGTHGYALGHIPVKHDTPKRVATATDIKGHDYNKRIYSAHGKCPTLAASSGGNLETKIDIRKKSKTVRASGRGSFDRHEWDSISNCHYRKLTPLECERLQCVPDNYTNHVSNTQRYKMLGNGWTVDVIAHIFSQMELPIQVFARQLDMFEDAA